MCRSKNLDIRGDNLSRITSETIVSFLPHIGIDTKDMDGKNIMSVGEGIPFLANFLSTIGARVTAVDPLYANSPKDIYEKLSFIRNKSVDEIRLLFSSDDPFLEQMNKLKNVIDKGREYFIKSLFDNTKIQFNDSVAENINNVEDHSQDFVIVAFLLNNLKNEEDALLAIIESINKLKKGGKLIIIGPYDSYLNRLELPTLKKRYLSQEFEYHDTKYSYKACSF